MICQGCGRENRPGRRYCGRCGQNLDPACRRCNFENEPDDRFCGGCGDQLGVAAAPAASLPPARRTATISVPVVAPVVPAAADALSAAELAELLAPAGNAKVVALPDGTIGQDDLDALFGGDA